MQQASETVSLHEESTVIIPIKNAETMPRRLSKVTFDVE